MAYRVADIGALAERAFGVRDSLSGMRKLLHGLELSWLRPRPRHPASDAEAQAEFKKNCRGWSPRSRRLDRREEARRSGVDIPDPLHAELLRRAEG